MDVNSCSQPTRSVSIVYWVYLYKYNNNKTIGLKTVDIPPIR